MQSDEDDIESNNGGMVIADENGDRCQTGILAVKACIAGKEINDLIVDITSAIFLVSSQFYETITNGKQLTPIKGRYMVANEFLLNIKGSVELIVASIKFK